MHDAENLHTTFQEAIKQARQDNKPLSLAIIGCGATGVQLAAELCNAIDNTPDMGPEMRRKYLKPILIEAMGRVLPTFSETVSAEAEEELTKIGYDVMTNAMVSEIDATGIKLKDGRYIEASIRIWAAGVQASAATSIFKGLDLSRSGQIIVTPTLQSTKDPSILAIGDCARVETNPLPPTAQVARQQGRYAGYIAVPTLLNGRNPIPFDYTDRGAVVVLSHYNAWGMWPSKKDFGGRGLGAKFAHFIHEILYRQHQSDLTGIFHAGKAALLGKFKPYRPRLGSGSSGEDKAHSP
ncbi:NAD(P)/FAD-dependent oxidoreductase [Aristophania vespae]|uniref:NAD(P)/FAD-dependent oxidoreductase n=1 Tax=Aristophania vespae TaxID=2697033 RepID=UPI001F4762F9|nr:FAD-dependent oxidoreductase [Aristophania vespae]